MLIDFGGPFLMVFYYYNNLISHKVNLGIR